MKTYTKEEIRTMAEHALNAACESIQDALGQTDGGMAGMYFSGSTEEVVIAIFESYIRTEINFFDHEKPHNAHCPAVDGFGCHCP